MPRVLIITFCYPPTQVIGSVRPAGLAKYLPQFGWEPVILTPKVDRPAGAAGIIETEYRDFIGGWKVRLGLDGKQGLHQQLRLPVSSKPGSGLLHTRALGLAKYIVAYPDEMKGWIPFAVQAIKEMADQGQKGRRDSQYVSAHFQPSHSSSGEIYSGLSVDRRFRDLWTQNLSNPYPRLDSMQIGLEKRTLKGADALVTVSEPWAARLQKRHPSKKILSITNGFDPEHFASVSRTLTPKFTITYAGLLYQGRRDPKLLFEVLRDLLDENILRREDVCVRFYGKKEPFVEALSRQYDLEDVVEINGVVIRSEALQRQAESQILLMLGWTDPRETGQHRGKLFEYLGAARPILAVGGSASVLTDTLNETGAGTHTFSKADIRDFLIAAYGEFQTRGYVAYRGQEAAVARYTHLQMAGRFAEVLDEVGQGTVATGEKVAVANYAR